MNILFYRYGSICEPDIIQAFQSLNIHVTEECAEITDKSITPAARIRLLAKHMELENYLFVFSINFFPAISSFCNRFGILYVCWCVDSPVYELFYKEISNSCNRIFIFDFALYSHFHKYNPDNIFHLPLGTNTERWNQVLGHITQEDRKQYGTDISFVGSLYTEKCRYDQLTNLDEYTRGYVNGLMDSQLKVFGCNLIEDSLTEQVIDAFRKTQDILFQYEQDNMIEKPDSYVTAHNYIGFKVTQLERIRTLTLLAEAFSPNYDVTLFTRSLRPLPKIQLRKGVSTLTEMPKVFYLSKINLNITMRPIITGLPLRIWDVLGCGGFLLTNYQEEIPEYLEIGTDLEAYASPSELLEKAAYYLEHEEERMTIARNGYEKVCQHHSYHKRIAQILNTIF